MFGSGNRSRQGNYCLAPNNGEPKRENHRKDGKSLLIVNNFITGKRNRFMNKKLRRRQAWPRLVLLALQVLFAMEAGAQDSRYPLIPYPALLQPGKGYFILTKDTRLVKETGEARFAGERHFLQELLRRSLGDSLRKTPSPNQPSILFRYNPSLTKPGAYRLEVNEKSITLQAKEGAGMFYAIETLRQLLPAAIENSRQQQWKLPAVTISDQPAFSWRGMHLDVSRHFFSLEYLRKYADLMALYKLNKLHLHLTDDQGWRIEIKKYPLLTSIGAWRAFERHDSACMQMAASTGNKDFEIDPAHTRQQNGKQVYGGFYTQEEMKAFIAYAADRHIEVIPEIDMPGHMEAAIRAYPWLTCDSTRNTGPGFSTPVCPCNEDVITFSKNILEEIAALFPSRYIHIGGDEVDTKNWTEAAASKAFMQSKGMSRPSELQVYFNRRIQQFLEEHGKTMIGWDEIVETGIDSNATVMFWRTWAGKLPAQGTANGNEMIMTPDGPYYFDAMPDKNSVFEVYQYDPLDTMYHIRKEDAHRVIGVQANLWTEMIPTEARADYMILPRMMALSEVGWTYRRRYGSFLNRLAQHYPRLDNLGVRYRLPDLEGLLEKNIFVKERRFFVASPDPYYTVRFTTDGSLPGLHSASLSDSITIRQPQEMRLALFAPNGHRGDVYNLSFNGTAYTKPVQSPGALDRGILCSVYGGNYSNTGQMPATGGLTAVAGSIAVPKPAPGNSFGLRFTGYINVPETGIYSFYLNCNDGGVLWIAGEKIVDNDGLHPDREKGGQVALEKGLHPLRLDFFDAGGGYRLELKYSIGKEKAQPVPSAWLLHLK